MTTSPNATAISEVLKGQNTCLSKQKPAIDHLAFANQPSFELSALPKTRFYGSKRRLASWLHEAFSTLRFQNCLDAFGGTSTVSLLFKAMNKDLTFNDALTSNSLSAKALLSNSPVKLNNLILDSYTSCEQKEGGKIHRLFKDFFFTDSENIWLDSFVLATKNETDPLLYAEIYYCLFQACLQKRPFNLFHRKNLNIRTNCTRQTKFGNWRTWERGFDELMSRALLDLEKSRKIKNGTVDFLDSMDASDIKPGYDLVYLDPPYVAQNSNELTYMDRYHFLEGLLDYDNWENRIDHSRKSKPIFSGKPLTEWNKKDSFKDRLYSLIDAHKQTTVALSYLCDAYPDQDDLVRYFKSKFKNVVIFSQIIPHALSKKEKIEILIVGIN